jgi:hypothetical protein
MVQATAAKVDGGLLPESTSSDASEGATKTPGSSVSHCPFVSHIHNLTGHAFLIVLFRTVKKLVTHSLRP